MQTGDVPARSGRNVLECLGYSSQLFSSQFLMDCNKLILFTKLFLCYTFSSRSFFEQKCRAPELLESHFLKYKFQVPVMAAIHRRLCPRVQTSNFILISYLFRQDFSPRKIEIYDKRKITFLVAFLPFSLDISAWRVSIPQKGYCDLGLAEDRAPPPPLRPAIVFHGFLGSPHYAWRKPSATLMQRERAIPTDLITDRNCLESPCLDNFKQLPVRITPTNLSKAIRGNNKMAFANLLYYWCAALM